MKPLVVHLRVGAAVHQPSARVPHVATGLCGRIVSAPWAAKDATRVTCQRCLDLHRRTA